MNSNQHFNPDDPVRENRFRRNFNNIIDFLRWFGRNRRIQVIFLIMALSLPLFLIIYGIILPARSFKPSASLAIETPAGDSLHAHSVSLDSDQLADVRSIIALENERAFSRNRISLAGKDSIYLIIDLPDSMLMLEIKGVPVRKNKILKMDLSNRFSLISHENLLPWITTPFTLERELSTIPKMPIVVKQAPKDTIEAAQASSAPLPPESTAVFFTLYFDRNLIIEIEQSDPPDEEDLAQIKSYRSMKRKESNRSAFHILKNPAQADQPMHISLEVSEDDARAVYRAIPSKTHLILKL